MGGCAVIGPAAPFNGAWRDIGQLMQQGFSVLYPCYRLFVFRISSPRSLKGREGLRIFARI